MHVHHFVDQVSRLIDALVLVFAIGVTLAHAARPNARLGVARDTVE